MADVLNHSHLKETTLNRNKYYGSQVCIYDGSVQPIKKAASSKWLPILPISRI